MGVEWKLVRETAGLNDMNDGLSFEFDRVVTSVMVGNNAPGLHERFGNVKIVG